MSLCCSPLRKKVLRAILIDRALESEGDLIGNYCLALPGGVLMSGIWLGSGDFKLILIPNF